MDFKCTSCGLCCKNVGAYVEKAKEKILNGDNSDLVKEVASFPHDYDNTGKCEMLLQDNKCKIYNERPQICNVEKTRETHFNMVSKESYYEIAETICKKLQEDGL